MRIKAICFDIDGTLYPNWKMYYYTKRSVMIDMGLMKRFGKVRKAIRETEGEGDFRKRQATMVNELYDNKFEVEDIERRIDENIYGIWERSFRGLKPFHGMRDTIMLLKDKELKVGVMSDFQIQNKLRYMDLGGKLFEVKICAEDTGELKPHKKPFEELIAQMGCKPEEILYVGNSYDKDIVGAKNAGLLAAHLTKKKLPGSVANINFKDYGEFEQKLKKLMID